ncbi:MAG: histidine phosphatase family protein [Candidatus Edwardsbacteria bacterium]|nr:histidine phosphatase family protein [Candidatus Edwardsbacteria bacterium]
MELILVRHGQTQWNKEQIFRGSKDIELDKTGRQQAEALGERLKSRRIDAIYSSSLKRAMYTAEAIARLQGLPVMVGPGLVDMCFGEWEGLAHQEVKQKYPKQYQAWRENPWKARIPGASNIKDVQAQSMRAIKGMIEDHPIESTIAVVTHRVILKLILMRMLNMGPEGFWNIKLSPCGLTTLEWDGKRFVLTCLNDTNHLDQLNIKQMDF